MKAYKLLLEIDQCRLMKHIPTRAAITMNTTVRKN